MRDYKQVYSALDACFDLNLPDPLEWLYKHHNRSMLDAVQNVEFEDWQAAPLYEMNQRANTNFVYREMEKAYFDK